MINNCLFGVFTLIRVSKTTVEFASLQTHHVYSTLKRRGHKHFHVVLMWNVHGVSVGCEAFSTEANSYALQTSVNFTKRSLGVNTQNLGLFAKP